MEILKNIGFGAIVVVCVLFFIGIIWTPRKPDELKKLEEEKEKN